MFNTLGAKMFMMSSYTPAEKYFYLVLCQMHQKYQNDKGIFLGHDMSVQNGVPSFSSFGLSRRVCKNARKKLKADGLIRYRQVYGRKGYRIGTEYTFLGAGSRQNPKEIHALILNKEPLKLSTSESCLVTGVGA